MRKFGYVQQIIEDFYQSEKDCMVVSLLPGTYSTYNSGYTSYRQAVKKFGYPIAIRKINSEIYLIRIKNPQWTARNYTKLCTSCTHRFPSKECATCDNLINYCPKGDDNNASVAREADPTPTSAAVTGSTP